MKELDLSEPEKLKCLLFDSEDKLLTDVTSILHLFKLRLEIKKNNLTGYYILSDDVKYEINPNGMMSNEAERHFNGWFTALMQELVWS